MQDSERSLADGTRRDSRAVAANRRLTLNPFRAPPLESARPREGDTDVMRVTLVPGAARCDFVVVQVIRCLWFRPSVQRLR